MRPIVVSVGPGAPANSVSQWVSFDPYARGSISKQCVVNGTVNYTVQITNDDPNSPTNPVPAGSVTWFSDPDTNFVGASASEFGYWAFTPLWARILLNSGTGTVTATFVQQDGGR